LLADLAEHGIDLQPLGDVIRYRPRNAMTPALLQRLRASKAELLAMSIIQKAHDLGDADLAELLAEGWHERIAIATEDGKASQQTAETVALHQLRMTIEEFAENGQNDT
jgi:TubC N-terminal docking domain